MGTVLFKGVLLQNGADRPDGIMPQWDTRVSK